jgi:hypothetical protein
LSPLTTLEDRRHFLTMFPGQLGIAALAAATETIEAKPTPPAEWPFTEHPGPETDPAAFAAVFALYDYLDATRLLMTNHALKRSEGCHCTMCEVLPFHRWWVENYIQQMPAGELWHGERYRERVRLHEQREQQQLARLVARDAE